VPFQGFSRGLERREREALTLEKIEVIQDKEDGQYDIDNHTSQNYNVEHF
jgi:hypothetical protein